MSEDITAQNITAIKGEVHPKTKFTLKALFTSKKHQAA